MGPWFCFFAGTPRRFLVTVSALAVLFGLFFPEVVGNAVHALLDALLRAVAPFVGPLLTLGIVILGLGIMLRGVFPKKKSKK